MNTFSRFKYSVTVAGLLGLSACGGLSEDERRFAQACEQDGGLKKTCECVAGGLSDELSKQEVSDLVALFDSASSGDVDMLLEQSLTVMTNADKYQQMQRFGNLIEALSEQCS